MNRPRSLRWLRISFSALCVLTCVLLIALWGRSYTWRHDFRGVLGTNVLNIQILRGELGIRVWEWKYKRFPWQYSSYKLDEEEADVDEPGQRLWPPLADRLPLSIFGIRWQTFEPAMNLFAVRLWALSLLAACLAAIPWLPWSKRFSLRALLIAVTLLSIALGTVVYLLAR